MVLWIVWNPEVVLCILRAFNGSIVSVLLNGVLCFWLLCWRNCFYWKVLKVRTEFHHGVIRINYLLCYCSCGGTNFGWKVEWEVSTNNLPCALHMLHYFVDSTCYCNLSATGSTNGDPRREMASEMEIRSIYLSVGGYTFDFRAIIDEQSWNTHPSLQRIWRRYL